MLFRLELFARWGTRLDEETRKTLERGRRVREVLKQPQYHPLPVAEQIAVLLAVTEGVFDDLPVERTSRAKKKIQEKVSAELPEVCKHIQTGEKLSHDDREALVKTARNAVFRLEE